MLNFFGSNSIYPQADILFVAGGTGDADGRCRYPVKFLKQQAEQADYVTSVCTGSLVLAAAGVLTGYRATCHWPSLEQLAYFGIKPANQ